MTQVSKLAVFICFKRLKIFQSLNHPLARYKKFSEKLIFLTPLYVTYSLPPYTSHIPYPLIRHIFLTPLYVTYSLPPYTSHIPYPLIRHIFLTPLYVTYSLPPYTSHIPYPLIRHVRTYAYQETRI